MGRVSVQCQTLAQKEVRITINGCEQRESDVTAGQEVVVRFEEVKAIHVLPVLTQAGLYLKSFACYGKVIYGKEIENPFQAVCEITFTMPKTDVELALSLHHRQEHGCFAWIEEPDFPIRLKQYEKNAHWLSWLLVLQLVWIPMLILAGIGFEMLWKTGADGTQVVPISAAILLSVLYAGILGFAIGKMIHLIARK